ncbi:MAG: valine--tRNA ligase [Caldilineae bacterium]|nr:valine--tRNA ligase [Caldilineae bacterium]
MSTPRAPQGEMPTQYEPAGTEPGIYQRWLDAKAFRAVPDARGEDQTYVVMMPLPNVTGALHMGHAMDNVMQDLLVRWHRMQGDNSLWMPGTDHAGIATQAVVEKRLLEHEGKTRVDIGREGLVERIWAWKDQYQARIIAQQQAMGCSCDWERQRFTMDAVCSRAVRWTFFGMFRDGLIYRGMRLVNWDCALQTAVADDEIEHKTVDGFFYHLRYPVIDPGPGEPEYVEVATTRPETMLGDTAVACHPDPGGRLAALIDETRGRIATAARRDRPALEEQLAELESRLETHLPGLLKLVAMAEAGRQVRLPLADRAIPIIVDTWAKPELGSGVVKITPGHDPNDYAVWQRHADTIGILNILEPDGRLNGNAGAYAGIDRFEARGRIEADLAALGCLGSKEARQIEMGHSDRSKTPIEPFLSRQWFVNMGDVEGGILCGRGTERSFRAAGLAQAAIDAVAGEWRSPSGRKITFHPDSDRYGGTYLNWLSEKRDWCISRQLWWGHRIPIWSLDGATLDRHRAALEPLLGRQDLVFRLGRSDGASLAFDAFGGAEAAAFMAAAGDGGSELLACPRDERVDAELVEALERAGFVRDPDVLDTWFSSGIWPHSTLGWPDPETAEIEAGQLPLGAGDAGKSALDAYYPGSCLVTGRDIITLWVARMAMMGLYNLGDLPFTDVFIHANILDGKGERMSKSKGNGIDPVDIIEAYGTDAMRYVLCEMQTGTQDIRLPVQAISPFTGKLIELAEAKHGRSIFTYLDPETGQEFDVLGSMPGLPAARLVSDRFIVGRNFCNKLWNATRFALLNLDGTRFQALTPSELELEDRWILSRLVHAVDTVDRELTRYNPAAAIGAVRDVFWNELCDWYLELIKPRLAAGGDDARVAQQVLATVLDQILRLLHPFLPFITEALWERLNQLAPERGIASRLPDTSGLLITAAWPSSQPDWRMAEQETIDFGFAQDAVRAIRDVRNQYNVPPARKLEVLIRAEGRGAEVVTRHSRVLAVMAGLESVTIDAEATRAADAATAVLQDLELYLPGLIDLDQERARLEKQRDGLIGRIDGLRQRLGNASFVDRAKPEVVDGARQQLKELEAQLAGVEANLAALPS